MSCTRPKPKPIDKDTFIHLVMPVYYTQCFKTKADKTFLVSQNWYRNAHHFIKNEVKRWFTDYILAELKAQKAEPIKGPYELAIVYHYKNKTSDLGNVCGLASKHANDAFEKYGLIQNDNVKFCKKEAYYVGSYDKDNPRVELYVRAVQEELPTKEIK